MKIGIYDPYLDDLGGGEKYMMTIAECLSKNHTVTVFWDDASVKEGLKQRFSFNFDSVRFEKNIFSNTTSTIQRLLWSRSYDCIIVLSDGSIPFLLSKKTFLHVQQPLPKAKKTIVNSLKMKRINGIFCNSEFTKRYVDKSLGCDSKILYPPIVLKPKNVKKENVILHVGRFRVQKNSDSISDYKKQFVMVSAFVELVKKGKLNGWKFILCVSVRSEDRNAFEQLKNMAKGFPVEFAINKSNDELWEYYSISKIYWHASGFGEDINKFPERAEHFGISTVEAMGAGAVPIVINSGGQKEIIKHEENGFLWNTIEELGAYTLEVASDEEKRKNISREAKKRASFFESGNFCRSLFEILGNI